MSITTKSILLILISSMTCGCLPFKLEPWAPGQYTLKEILREYRQGTYKESFSLLPYEEKMNICHALFTQVHPEMSSIISIFEDSDHETADKVMIEIIDDANNNDAYMVWMKVKIWDVIAGKKREEYHEDRLKILDVIKKHESEELSYWNMSIATLGGF